VRATRCVAFPQQTGRVTEAISGVNGSGGIKGHRQTAASKNMLDYFRRAMNAFTPCTKAAANSTALSAFSALTGSPL
jgi:hypothetical protein